MYVILWSEATDCARRRVQAANRPEGDEQKAILDLPPHQSRLRRASFPQRRSLSEETCKPQLS